MGFVALDGQRFSLGSAAIRSSSRTVLSPRLAPQLNMMSLRANDASATQYRHLMPANAVDLSSASVESMITKSKGERLTHLEEQAMEALKFAVENSEVEHPVFPCAMIAGDMVILDLL